MDLPYIYIYIYISITLKFTCFCSCFRADKITKLEDCYNLKGIYIKGIYKQKEHPDPDPDINDAKLKYWSLIYFKIKIPYGLNIRWTNLFYLKSNIYFCLLYKIYGLMFIVYLLSVLYCFLGGYD